VPRLVDHDRRREKLLEKTFRLFVRHGFAGVTMRQVAVAADVSIGSLYHYFKDKDDLFEQMLTFLVDREISIALDRLGTPSSAEEGVARVWAFVGERERPLAELLHVSLDHQRSTPASKRSSVSVGAQKFREVIATGLGLDEAASAALFERLLGRLVAGMLAGGTVRSATAVAVTS